MDDIDFHEDEIESVAGIQDATKKWTSETPAHMGHNRQAFDTNYINSVEKDWVGWGEELGVDNPEHLFAIASSPPLAGPGRQCSDSSVIASLLHTVSKSWAGMFGNFAIRKGKSVASFRC